MTYGWFPFVYRLILANAKLLVLKDDCLQNSWLPLQNYESPLHWLVHLRHEEQVLINLYLYSALITFIICPCAFIAISMSSEVYTFSNLHLSRIVRIIKAQPCYQRHMTDQRKRKREFILPKKEKEPSRRRQRLLVWSNTFNNLGICWRSGAGENRWS